ncbi:MAG: tRNA (guanosine(37)-N1)-methyltransferase TrmD [Opitutales bacterium]|nr:tRNA (guanosine(37)-N1)-methyltransferase TrmD [Opitutales bacterium]
MKIDLITLFPGMIRGFLEESMLGRAQEKELLTVGVHDLRQWGEGKHRIVDDRPFGGGAGMLLKPGPLGEALDAVESPEATRIYLCPDGEPLTTNLAKELAAKPHLVLLSGHYEGIDERIRTSRIDREVSIGDYVLTNGTLAAAVLIDAVARHIPGVLGEEKSLTQDSFSDSLLSFPQFTRPAIYRGMAIPDILLTGNHEAIAAWRQEQRELRTRSRRPDLFLSPNSNKPEK